MVTVADSKQIELENIAEKLFEELVKIKHPTWSRLFLWCEMAGFWEDRNSPSLTAFTKRYMSMCEKIAMAMVME